MTRTEFLEDVTTFGELFDFCDEHGLYSYTEDLLYCEDLDESVDNDLSEYVRDEGWQNVRDALDDISTGYDWYRKRGLLYYEGLDDYDFDRMKDEVYENAVVQDLFDDDEEGEEEEIEDNTPVKQEFRVAPEDNFTTDDSKDLTTFFFVDPPSEPTETPLPNPVAFAFS